MTRVVISERFGGFGLSPSAVERMRELGWDGKYDRDIDRDDARLVRVVEEMGGADASSAFAWLAVVDVPDGVGWHVHEYDGFESVHENHRTWGSDGEGDCA